MTQRAEFEEGRRRGEIVFVVTGAIAVIVGLIGLGTIGYRHAVDMGWTGSGSAFVDSRTPVVLGILVGVVCALAGAAVILVRRDVVATSLGGLLLLGTVIALAITVVVGVRAYPQVEQAVLIAYDDADWRTRLPVTEVFGVRSETDRTITVEGRADRRGCSWRSRSVTIDRTSGRIVEVVELPTSFPAGEEPPALVPIDVRSYRVIQGTAPFICRN